MRVLFVADGEDWTSLVLAGELEEATEVTEGGSTRAGEAEEDDAAGEVVRCAIGA